MPRLPSDMNKLRDFNKRHEAERNAAVAAREKAMGDMQKEIEVDLGNGISQVFVCARRRR